MELTQLFRSVLWFKKEEEPVREHGQWHRPGRGWPPRRWGGRWGTKRKILAPHVYCSNFRLLKRLLCLCVCVCSIVQRRTHICNLRKEMRSMMKRGTEYQYIRRLDYSFIYLSKPLLIHLAIQTLTHLSLQTLTHLFIYPFKLLLFHTNLYSSSHPNPYSSIHPSKPLLIHPNPNSSIDPSKTLPVFPT